MPTPPSKPCFSRPPNTWSALTVAQQTVLLNPKPAGQVMTLAAMHEIENAQSLIEMALSRVQSRH